MKEPSERFEFCVMVSTMSSLMTSSGSIRHIEVKAPCIVGDDLIAENAQRTGSARLPKRARLPPKAIEQFDFYELDEGDRGLGKKAMLVLDFFPKGHGNLVFSGRGHARGIAVAEDATCLQHSKVTTRSSRVLCAHCINMRIDIRLRSGVGS